MLAAVTFASYTLLLISLLLGFFTFSSDAQPSIRINELLASNASILADEKNEFDDWVEIHNSSKDTVNLAAMFLANNLQGRAKWKFPDGNNLTVIPPKGFLMVWCDNDLEQDSLLHASFKLDPDGEVLYLLARDGKTVLDSVRYPEQHTDFSYGRIGEGREWSYFLQPSPHQPNTGVSKIERACPAPEFETTESFIPSGSTVALKLPDGCQVYYTADGAEPHPARGSKYESAFQLNKTTVVRARAFRDGYLPGKIAVKTFFIAEDITVPVVSLVTNSSNLWDPQKGIYANPFMDVEVPAHFEYFHKGGKPAFSADVALKIFGNTSRNSAKQSFVVLAREKFGSDRLHFAFFPDKPMVSSADGVILRSDVTSGRGGGDRETAGERIKNELMYHLIRQAGGHCDVQAYQPVVLFLNGSYWGLYNLMERKGKNFIKNNHGVDDIDMLNSYRLHVVEGDSVHYLRMLEFIESNDLQDDKNMEQLCSWIDVESLMDYWIFELYSATHDYSVNIRMWRPRSPDGKWRWLAFDEDSWGKWDEKTLDDFITDDETEEIFLIAPMLVNEAFRNRFINRIADMLNTVLLPQNVIRLIDEIQSVIKNEKERDYNRWKNLVHFVEPGSQIAFLKEFAEKRPDYLRKEIAEHFELPGTSSLTLNVSGNGIIMVNTIRADAFPWTGIYFQNIPVTLTAVPLPGHRFIGWTNKSLPPSETVTISLSALNHSLTAKFD